LVEPQRTNLITYSNNLDNPSYGLETGGTATLPIVTANYGISPDGTQNAERVQFSRTGTTPSSYSILSKGMPLVSGSATVSFYAKTITGTTNLLVYFNSSGQEFIITNQWQRFTFTLNSDDANYIQIGSRGGSGNFYSGGSENIDILLWGIQKEAGSYATSYIPTVASTVTRNADVISKTGISSLIGQTEGTLFLDFYYDGISSNLVLMQTFQNASQFNVIQLVCNASKRLAFEVGADASIISTNPISAGRLKIAGAYKNNDFALYLNGTQLGVDTSGSVIATDSITFNDYFAIPNTYKQLMQINSAQLYKTRLTNSELQSLTTL
jgi:hypothetical protein